MSHNLWFAGNTQSCLSLAIAVLKVIVWFVASGLITLHDPLECIYLGVRQGTITYINVCDALLEARFPVVSTNSLGTMMLLEPAARVPDQSYPNGQ